MFVYKGKFSVDNSQLHEYNGMLLSSLSPLNVQTDGKGSQCNEVGDNVVFNKLLLSINLSRKGCSVLTVL